MKSLALIAFVTAALLVLTYGPNSIRKADASSSPHTGLENYDIRIDKSADGMEILARLRGATTPVRIAPSDSRYKLEHNTDLGIVEVISPADVGRSLAQAKRSTRAATLREFVLGNERLFAVPDAGQLIQTADYTNPDGNLSFARLEQYLGEVPVFGSEVNAGFDKNGYMFRVINSLAPAIDAHSINKDFGDPRAAVVNAAKHISIEMEAGELAPRDPKGTALSFHADRFNDIILAERFYFPVCNGAARPAWRVFLSGTTAAYYVVVDADGTLLWRRSLIEHQTLPATYNVYADSTSFLKTLDSPSPFTPGCTAPTGCAQPPAVARTNLTLIGNEAPYAFNNIGWIPDTGLPVRTPANPNITDGNNVEAGVDRMMPDGIDDNGWAVGSPSRVFSYAYNPAPGMPPPGEEPLPPGPQPYPPTAFQQGSVTQAFYVINRWHDELYRLGFTEPARNFQHFNFGRGGAEGDRVSMEVQEWSGTNGANFLVTADGQRGKVQMFIFTGPTPDRDGALDAQVVTHEMTHGLSTRLIGNSTGISSNMPRGMGEGWSDFYSFALLSDPADDRLGVHSAGGYVTYQLLPGYESNYYYGLRRFPVAVRASRGPNGLPHNPLTFRYLNSDCLVLIGTTSTNPNSAYPRGPIGVPTCDQVHNLGEVWAVILWEVRDQLIKRHGAAEGNRRALQYITDGMKLTPLNPTMVQMRDAVLAGVAASALSDVGPVWRGFAIRGMGTGASVANPGTGNNNTVVIESFDIPIQFRRPARADFDGDGRTDVSVFRPSDRVWYLNRSFAGFAAATWGLSTDQPVPDDYDGDGKTDITVFRATADGALPDFYIMRSADSTIAYISWGTTGDVPLSEDFDGDNKADQVIYRASTSQFWVRRSTDGSALNSPLLNGSPVVGDFDGDDRADFGVFNGGTWTLRLSSGSFASPVTVGWGTLGDIPAHGDFDGDGLDDPAVFRPSNGTWYISNSGVGGNTIVNFGLAGDIPVQGDYDGDGRADIAVYRNGIWYINNSTGAIVITSFGLAGDNPLPGNN